MLGDPLRREPALKERLDPVVARWIHGDHLLLLGLERDPEVIEDEDADPTGAFWGEINTTVHRGLGCSGALTNGVLRDLGDLPPGFPVLAGALGPSHAFVHITALAVPVTVFGLRVAPGDLVHADRHGALVVPAPLIPALPDALARLRASEAVILGPARAGFARFEEFERAEP